MIAEVDFGTKFDFEVLMHQATQDYLDSIHEQMQAEWEMLVENYESENFHAEFLQLKQNHEERIREFHLNFFLAHHQEEMGKVRQKSRSKTRLIKRLKEQLAEKDRQLYEKNGDLEIEKRYSAYLKEAKLCPECKSGL